MDRAKLRASRFRELLGGRGGQVRLAEALGLEVPVINNWTRRGVAKSEMYRVKEHFGVSYEWLDGDPEAAKYGDREDALEYPLDSSLEQAPNRGDDVPLISWTQAGDWEPTFDPYSPGEAEEWLPNPTRSGPHTYALRVVGESMWPTFSDGDIIFVDPERSPRHNDFVVARLATSDRTTFKQLKLDQNGNGTLHAVNDRYPDPIIPADENVFIKGVVVFSGRAW